ncbi:LutC/YkgG family protein [Aeromonas hydrophila]|uniref:LutC/YkgG family protein n=1 Tax=Aeromonas hydrophila TaxID=644 RepID=UPI000493712C|nr:LUD domain-containing protein [Aeromonas hydrophila]MCP3287219.1 LUD domain-containing protein [Aeromonas hydrophila]HAT1543487.1 lactate utilization protein [Aeromonas hydrophila]HAT1553954.1 lactate utilization protein [Aeromonas hydrophila]HAU4893867.1 lactate utilization protein [Aeromonas hydrophila]HAU4974763.1 lactate utilization protein [Aeromonas hydrophila]
MSSKEAILSRLRGAATPIAHAPHGWQPWRGADEQARRERFVAGISASHAEILTVKEATLARDLSAWLDEEGVTSLACGQGGRWQDAVAAACAGRSVLAPAGEFAGWKDELFDVCQAGITHCAGAIADTGTLVLLPDNGEPRTLSLVPPCHIALLAVSTIADNLAGLVDAGRWQQAMPTNLLLVSGPSKTADIQQTLAYGAHGPSRLLVVLVEDC